MPGILWKRSQILLKLRSEEDKTGNETKERIPQLSSEESLVFEVIGPYPVHIDELARKLSMKPGKLSSILLQLELKNIVHQSPGKLFSRTVMK